MTHNVEEVPRFCICVPYFGGKDWEHEKCMRQAERLSPDLPVFMTIGHPYIDMARALLVQDFLDWRGRDGQSPPLDCMLFIDHDILFEPWDCVRIVRAALERNAVVGGPYPKKTPGADLIGGFDDTRYDEVVFFDDGDLYHTNYNGLGMGFTAIPRTILEKVGESLPLVKSDKRMIRPYFQHMVEDDSYFGEDFSFCRRVRKAGFDIFTDTRIRLAHKGSYKYTVEDCGVVVPQALTSLRAKLKKEPVQPQVSETEPNRD